MKKLVLIAAMALAAPASGQAPSTDAARWEQQARNVTIIRDDWGIAHVYGKTDADAVFGMIYAQAEDDFNRVESNYLTSLGRTAEAEGESKIWQDLRMRLIIDPDSLKAEYASSPAWLKSLMNAWADGLNFYLARHPQVKPKVITRWEPWMALSFTEGSIGGDIEKVNLNRLQAFYGDAGAVPASSGEEEDESLKEPSGSNGAVISPANTTGHHSLLLINPHTSFFFRSELQMASEEGLNAYGAVTWGQFFVYQGFNDHAGWMHTSSGVDATDEFLETVSAKPDGHYYKVGNQERPMHSWPVVIRYRTGNGMAERKFTLYRTEHGPIVREENGKWVSFALMQSPVKALTQSYTRTKATDYKSFLATMQLHTNSSNNTLFADKDGDIAYFHGNYIPRRDTSFDWTKPVDGSNPATAYRGLLSVDETPHLLNPASGWIYNSNDAPWQASGPSSPKQANFPKYVETGGESARGHHAVRVLQDSKDFTLDGLRNAAFDSYQIWFEKPIPALIKAWDAAPARRHAQEQGRRADRACCAAGTCAGRPHRCRRRWRSTGRRRCRAARRPWPGSGAENAPPDQMLQALAAASDRLTADFGSWKTPWGEINRFQRINDDIVATFTDAGPSIPVMFSSANWGSLASFGARQYPGTKRIYGTSGNSFVAVVEFGDSVRAKAVTAGGESGDPASRHFNDQATRYATGDLRPVYYYRSQLKGHTEREYHPGS